MKRTKVKQILSTTAITGLSGTGLLMPSVVSTTTKTTLNTSPTSLTPIVPEDTVEQKVNKVSEQIENATQEFFQQQNAILNEKIEGNILINVKEGLDTIKDEINQKYTLEGFSIHVQLVITMLTGEAGDNGLIILVGIENGFIAAASPVNIVITN